MFRLLLSWWWGGFWRFWVVRWGRWPLRAAISGPQRRIALLGECDGRTADSAPAEVLRAGRGGSPAVLRPGLELLGPGLIGRQHSSRRSASCWMRQLVGWVHEAGPVAASGPRLPVPGHRGRRYRVQSRTVGRQRLDPLDRAANLARAGLARLARALRALGDPLAGAQSRTRSWSRSCSRYRLDPSPGPVPGPGVGTDRDLNPGRSSARPTTDKVCPPQHLFPNTNGEPSPD